MFSDKIRSANTEHEIYFLLTSYIEATWLADNAHGCIPEHVSRLPLNGKDDVRDRFNRLMIELDKASKRLDDDACVHVREGVHIFSFALNRLAMLDDRHYMRQDTGGIDLNAWAA